MKRTHLVFLAFLGLVMTAQAVLYQIHYDPTSTPQPNRITRVQDRFINESDPIPANAIRGWSGNPVRGVSLIQTIPAWQLYVSEVGNGADGQISQLTQAEIDGVIADEQAAQKSAAIAAAKALLASSQADQDRLVRALALVLLDEVNLIRSAIVTLHPAASGSLPQRTAQQLKTAIENKIDTSSDSL